MNHKFSVIFFGIFLFTTIANAQVDPDATGYYTDALKFSQTSPGGTARFLGIGGVNNALGADLSSLAGNPAGMGFYQKSEAGISTAFGFGNTSSKYLNSVENDNRDYFYFPNLGLAFTGRRAEAETGAFRGGSFGVGLTRIQNFQNQFSYNGKNDTTSITDYFVKLANGTPLSELDNSTEIFTIEQLAYLTYLISPNSANLNETQYHSSFNEGYSSKQEETVLTKGAINQWNFTYGGSFNDKIYIGASIGVPVLRYIAVKNYKESTIGSDTLDNLKFNETLKIRGTGINFKVGMIARPADWMRIGISLQTPTYYSINEEYNNSLKVSYKNVTYNDPLYGATPLYLEDFKTEPGVYKYNLVTPFKASGGIALFAGKAGFIAADIEYVPYSRARLKETSVYSTGDNSTFTGDNKTIKNVYQPTVNFGIGAEFRHKIYRFRAGYSRQGNGTTNLDNVDRKVVNISGGAGIRLENYYFDIAFVNSRYNSTYKPYTLQNGTEPTANVKSASGNLILSAGVFF